MLLRQKMLIEKNVTSPRHVPKTAATTSNLVKAIFWILVTIDSILVAIVFLALLGDLFSNAAPEVGGRLSAFLLLPMALGFVVWLYITSPDVDVQRLAIGILAVPVVALPLVAVYFSMAQNIERRDRAASSANDDAMERMVFAVERGDAAFVKNNGSGIDVNRAAKREMSLLKLAVHTAKSEQYSQQLPVTAQSPVVEALLQLHAKPDDGLWDAYELSDPAILKALLTAGADPNRMPPGECPLLRSVGDISVENFRLLSEHGLKVGALCNGKPFAVELADHRQWNLLTYLIEQRVDISKPREYGQTVASLVDEMVTTATNSKIAQDTKVLRIQALIKQQP